MKPHLLIDQYEGIVTQHDDSKRRRDEMRERGRERRGKQLQYVYYILLLDYISEYSEALPALIWLCLIYKSQNVIIPCKSSNNSKYN